MFSCFFLQSNKWGACVCRLRGSNQTSTLEYSFLTKLIPDLDNANVGTFVCITGNFQIGGFPYFILGGVIMVKVNGKELNIAGKTVSEYLMTINYDLKRIAVERNDDIVSKSQYDVTVLEDGDSLEIVNFVGGG